MKKTSGFLLYLFAILVCRAQNDTSKIYNSSQLKKGFYRNYEEYINNSPSLTPDFTTVLFFIKVKKDTVITGAKCHLNNGMKPAGNAWGCCDGTTVFINKRISLFKKRFLKIQYIGKNPFFLYWHKDIYTLGPPLSEPATADTAATHPFYDLMFINPAGNARIASYKNLKKLFAAAPDLLRRFKTERAFTNKIKTAYLVEFNEKYITDGTGVTKQ